MYVFKTGDSFLETSDFPQAPFQSIRRRKSFDGLYGRFLSLGFIWSQGERTSRYTSDLFPELIPQKLQFL